MHQNKFTEKWKQVRNIQRVQLIAQVYITERTTRYKYSNAGKYFPVMKSLLNELSHRQKHTAC